MGNWKTAAVRRAAAAWLVVLLLMMPVNAGTGAQNIAGIEPHVRELAADNTAVRATLADGTIVKGRIVSVGTDEFTLRQKESGADLVVPFGKVKQIRKDGLSRRVKAILIPAIIVGGVLIVFCAAPYPIGFLCREDPS